MQLVSLVVLEVDVFMLDAKHVWREKNLASGIVEHSLATLADQPDQKHQSD